MDNFGENSKELSDFFTAISVGKQKRKKELDEAVGNSVDDFFSTISTGKKIVKEKRESLVGDSFEKLFLSALTEENKPNKKKVQKEIVEEETIKKENKEEKLKENIIVEKSLGLLAEPSDVKQQNDPLTPLNQNFATIEDLNNHYKLFLSRIQQQLSTLGGGGETRLEFLDDVNRNSVKVNHKFLRYDSGTKKWVGSDAGEGPFVSSTKYITSSSYTILEHDYYIGVNYPGAVTITLPSGSVEGTTYIVKDERGESSKGMNRYITILPSGSDLIDGENRVILAYDFGSLTFVYRNGWRVV